MSTQMLCSILRVPVDLEHITDPAMGMTVMQVVGSARRAADMIERFAEAIRSANDCDTSIETSTDEMLDLWRKLHADVIREAEDFS